MRTIFSIEHITAIVIAILSLAACSKDMPKEDESIDIALGISGSEGWNSATRANELNNSTLCTEGVGVFAYYTAEKSWDEFTGSITTPNYINNTKVTSSDNGKSWNYSPKQYWPLRSEEKVSFFAYAPYISGQKIKNTTIDFSVNEDVSKQIDLTWSKSETTDLNKESGVVRFELKHALACIGFTANAKADEAALPQGTSVVIKQITVGDGLHEKGTLNLYNNTNAPAWENLSGGKSYTLDQTEFSKGSYIMVIPQDFQTDGLNIYIDYDVVLSDKGNEYHRYSISSKVNVKTNLEAGKKYIFNLSVGIRNATVDDVTIVPWQNSGEVNISGIVS